MALDETGMTARIFSDYTAVFPAAASLYRSNVYASPQIPPHRPMEEIAKILSSTVVTQVVSTVTFIGSGTGANVGPGIVAPDAPYQYDLVNFPGLSSTISTAKAAVSASLGWTGADSFGFLDGLIDPLLNYTAENISLQFPAPAPGQIVGSGGTLIVTAEPGSVSSLSSSLPIAVLAALEASPLLHLYDDPSLSPTEELVEFCTAIVAQVPTLLSTMSTSIVVAPVGSLGSTAFVATGGMV